MTIIGQFVSKSISKIDALGCVKQLKGVFFALKNIAIHHHTMPFTKKTLVVSIITASTMMSLPAQAGMFDSLVKIILPSYKKSPEPTPQDTPAPTPLVIEEPTQPPADSPQLDLPSILLDDSLSAGDITPVLEKPDLYALMSAEFYVDRGEVARALNIYKAESFKQNATAVFERALALSLEYEEPSESLRFATAWQLSNHDHIPAWFYVAHLAFKAKDYNQATQMIAKILNYDHRADLTRILTGILPTDRADQRNLFFALNELGDDNASISALRAGLLFNLGDYPPALLHINKALKAQPTNLAYVNLKIDILRAGERFDEMWAFVRAKRKQMPTEKDLHLYEIRHHIEHGRLEEAWQLLLVANQEVKNPEVSLLTALVGIDSEHPKQAGEILLTLAKNPSYTSKAHYYLGIIHERHGDISQALDYYEKVKDREHVLDARTKAVGFYLLNQDVDKAMVTLLRLREEHEVFATDSYILQAEILMRQGKKDLAIELLSGANREYPNDDRLLFASYQLLEDVLGPEDKKETLDKLLAIDPFHLDYQLADAKVRLEQDPDDQEALKTATEISQIPPDDPAYDSQLQLEALMVLASRAYTKGEHQAVIDYLQMPYELAPTLPVGIMLLRAYQGLGDNDRVNELLGELQGRFAFGQNQADIEQY